MNTFKNTKGLIAAGLLALTAAGCSASIPSERLRALPTEKQALSQYKQDAWECDNSALAAQRNNPWAVYWVLGAGLVGMAIAQSQTEGKENALWRTCMQLRGYTVEAQ
jgi:glucose/arabinose dehydrogenase